MQLALSSCKISLFTTAINCITDFSDNNMVLNASPSNMNIWFSCLWWQWEETGRRESRDSFVWKHMAIRGCVKECEIRCLSGAEAVNSHALALKLQILQMPNAANTTSGCCLLVNKGKKQLWAEMFWRLSLVELFEEFAQMNTPEAKQKSLG